MSTFPRLAAATFVLTLIALALAACGTGNRQADWDAFRDRFIEESMQAFPDFAVYQGRHEFDGQLPDWSQAGLDRNVQRLRTARETAAGFADEGLDDARRFEREYLLSIIDGQLFWIADSGAPHKNPDFYVGFFFLGPGVGPDVYLTRPYAPLADRLRAYITYARNIPTAVRQIRENLRPPLARPLIDIGRARYGGLAAYLRDDVPQVFAEVDDPALQAEFETANAAAATAFDDLDSWLETLRPTQTEAFALGPETFAAMVRATERVDVPLDRLEAVGREDLARNVAALTTACAEFAPGATVVDCVARAAAHKPEGGAVAGARGQLSTLRDFVAGHDLVSIPGTEQAEVRESPPYQRANFAYIDIPGPYETNLPSIYYIAPPDPAWSEAERNAYVPGVADLLFTSVHEVWPGHFLQFLHSNRAPSMVGRLWVSYAFAEGWAHYAEEMMFDAGVHDGTAETHIGQLLNALLRNARYLSAIGLHTGRMTVEESERLFREEAFQDAATARQQAARGTYDPAYLNYTLGKLMIRQLRNDWTASRGGRQAWKGFHDAFLSHGGPPVPLLRQLLLGGQAGPPL